MSLRWRSRKTILESIESQGKLTEELKAKFEGEYQVSTRRLVFTV